MKHKAKSIPGFTLVEIMVAMSIFLLVMLATIDTMLIVIRTQETITRIQAIQDNARFSLELITKEMRTGIGYRTSAPVCATSGSEIHFMSTSGRRVYYLDPAGSGKIYRYATATGPDITTPDQCFGQANNQFNEFTGSQVFVERFFFALRGQNPPSVPPNDGQAMAVITMKVRPTLVLQTTIVQRVRDVP